MQEERPKDKQEYAVPQVTLQCNLAEKRTIHNHATIRNITTIQNKEGPKAALTILNLVRAFYNPNFRSEACEFSGPS